MNYDPYKHHRRSIRLKGYDYSRRGWYFITICTQNREMLFGDVVDGKMILNEAGRIADKCWREIPEHYPNVHLDEYVIMPNHIHGIIIINDHQNVGANDNSPHNPPTANNIGTKNVLPIDNPGKKNAGAKNISHNDNTMPQNIGAKNISHDDNIMPQNIGAKNISHDDNIMPQNIGAKNISPLQSQFRSPSKTIGSIIRGFKIGVTKWFRQNTEIYAVWQRNYYEHIIRDENELNHIRQYIIENPLKWQEDKYY